MLNAFDKFISNLTEDADGETLWELGKVYMGMEPSPITHDAKKAVELFRKAAEKGEINGQYELAYCLMNGFGVEQNEEEGGKLYHEIADQGEPWALVEMARYYDGIGDKNKWLECMREAAEKDEAYAQEEVAFHYLDTGDPEAVKWCIQAAENNRINAQFALGTMYYEGTNGLEKDPEKAELWFSKAALNGYDLASDVLDQMHTKPIDEDELKHLMHDYDYAAQD